MMHNSRLKSVSMLLSILLLAVVTQAQTPAVSLTPEITTFAGNGVQRFGGDGGAASSAQLNWPYGVVVDSADNLYISDSRNHRVRKVNATTGVITTVAGNGVAGYSGDGGGATSAELYNPYFLAVDSGGNLYISDTTNQRIRKINANGVITTVAGNGMQRFGGDGGPATKAQLDDPAGVAVDTAGNLYIADTKNHRVRKVSTSGVITTVVGNGVSGSRGDGGPATEAELYYPYGLAVDLAGNLYIADSLNGRIRKVSRATGIITTVAGNGNAGYSGDGGAATSAELYDPYGVTVDSGGNMYICDSLNQRVRKVSAATGIITTVAGTGTLGHSGDAGPATQAELNEPSTVAVDSAGNLYIADIYNNRVRKVSGATAPVRFTETAIGSASAPQNVLLSFNRASITVTGVSVPHSQGGVQEFSISTIAGGVAVTFHPRYPGLRRMPLVVNTSVGTFHFGLEGLGRGPQPALLPGVITTVAGTGTQGDSGEGGLATKAELLYPNKVVMDAAGNLFIQDTFIRKVSAATGIITTFAGTEQAAFGGIALDAAGNLYFAAPNNNVVQKLSVDTGAITTVAGNGTGAGIFGNFYSGDGGAATQAELNVPEGIALDSQGNLYIADFDNDVIRKVSAATGIITTVAGNGTFANSGDGGPATKAALYAPISVSVDSAGNLYISDFSARIRKVNGTTGIITTIAGGGSGCAAQVDPYGDGCLATKAILEGPTDVVFDSAGNMYIADYFEYDSHGATFYSFIRKVSAATGIITTVAGEVTGTVKDGGPATSARLLTPSGVALDSAGNLYIADGLDYRVRKVSVNAAPLSFASTVTGSNSGARKFTLANIGNAVLKLSGITPSTNFKIDGSTTSCSTSSAVTAGKSCEVGVIFSPTAKGSRAGTVTLKDNALNWTGATRQVRLSGTGK